MSPNIFRPSRQFRRKFAGQPCPGCGNRVVDRDLWAVVAPDRSYYVHEACLRVLAEAAADSTPEEEMAESAAAGPIVTSSGDAMSLEPEEAL